VPFVRRIHGLAYCCDEHERLDLERESRAVLDRLGYDPLMPEHAAAPLNQRLAAGPDPEGATESGRRPGTAEPAGEGCTMPASTTPEKPRTSHCLYCGQHLGLGARLRKRSYCSDEHALQHAEEEGRKIVARIQEGSRYSRIGELSRGPAAPAGTSSEESSGPAEPVPPEAGFLFSFENTEPVDGLRWLPGFQLEPEPLQFADPAVRKNLARDHSDLTKDLGKDLAKLLSRLLRISGGANGQAARRNKRRRRRKAARDQGNPLGGRS
jgi:hypothetical protein